MISHAITRAAAVALIDKQFRDLAASEPCKAPVPDKHGAAQPPWQWHYGYCELRALLDAIYGGPPMSEDEEL